MKRAIAFTAATATWFATVWFGAPIHAESTVPGYTVVKTFALSSSAGASSAYQERGYVMAPIREVARSLGWDVSWNENTRSIEIGKGERVIRLRPNQSQGTVDGDSFLLPVPVVTKKQLSYAPLRALADKLGAETWWDSKTGTASIAVPNSPKGIDLAFDFDKGAEGWDTGVADLPVDYGEQDYQIDVKPASVPLHDGSVAAGMKLSGMNRSDDLFLFMTKKLSSAEGLRPNQEYEVNLRFDLATNEAESSLGIGGSPATAVYVKAGVVGRKPSVIEEGRNSETPYYRLNLDKGNQSTDGKDVALLGNVAKPDDGKKGFQLKPFEKTFKAKTDAAGELYVLIGTDSGYEGLSVVYVTNVKLTIDTPIER
jgi:hypothetical protein